MSNNENERELCKICLSRKIDTAFVPCGHRAICNDCSNDMKS